MTGKPKTKDDFRSRGRGGKKHKRQAIVHAKAKPLGFMLVEVHRSSVLVDRLTAARGQTRERLPPHNRRHDVCWLDSGASSSFCRGDTPLQNEKQIRKEVQGPGQSVMAAERTGTFDGVPGVIAVKGLREPLMSVGAIADHNAGEVAFLFTDQGAYCLPTGALAKFCPSSLQ